MRVCGSTAVFSSAVVQVLPWPSSARHPPIPTQSRRVCPHLLALCPMSSLSFTKESLSRTSCIVSPHHHISMARPSHGLLAQVRICTQGPGPLIHPDDLITIFDAVFRRATSVQRFVIRSETVASRREVVLQIAAVRYEATARADASVLLLLRRALLEIERRKWVLLEVDKRGFKSEAVWADYNLVPQPAAEAEMRRLESLSSSGSLASTDLPPRLSR